MPTWGIESRSPAWGLAAGATRAHQPHLPPRFVRKESVTIRMPTRLHLYCTTTPVVIIFRQQRFSKQRIILRGHALDKNGAGGPPLSRARFQPKLIFLAQNTKKEQSIDRRHARLSNQVSIDPIPIGRWAQPCLESRRPEQCAAPCFVT